MSKQNWPWFALGAGLLLLTMTRKRENGCPAGFIRSSAGDCVADPAGLGTPSDTGSGSAQQGGIREGDECNGLGWKWKKRADGMLVCGGTGWWPW